MAETAVLDRPQAPANAFHKFLFRSGDIKAVKLTEADGSDGYYLEAPASSTVIDRTGDRFTIDALRKMEDAAKRMTIFLNHVYDIPENIFGTCEKSEIVPAKDAQQGDCFDLIIRTKCYVKNERVMKTWDAINNGVRLGYSVGGYIPNGGFDFVEHPDGTYHFDIKDIDLFEISVVGIPAQQRAIIDDVAKGVRKKWEQLKAQAANAGKNFNPHRPHPTDEEILRSAEVDVNVAKSVSLNSKGKSHASSLISSGKVDKDSSWSFSAEDGNALLGSDGDDWENYSKWFLGHETGEDSKTKAAWKYPFGKDGKVYRSALTAIRQRAGQQGADAIFEVAGELLEKIDGKKDEEDKSVKLTPEQKAQRQKDVEAAFKQAGERRADLIDKVLAPLKLTEEQHKAIAGIGGLVTKLADDEHDTVKEAMGHMRKAFTHGMCEKSTGHMMDAHKCLRSLVPDSPEVDEDGGSEGDGKDGKDGKDGDEKKLAALRQQVSDEMTKLVTQVGELKSQLDGKAAEIQRLDGVIAKAKATPLGRATTETFGRGSEAPGGEQTADPETRKKGQSQIMSELSELVQRRGEPLDARSRSQA